MEKPKPSDKSREVEVVPFHQSLAPYFESLNREWIEKDFVVEETDLLVFGDPYGHIVKQGGQIFFVVSEGNVVGTCAVIPHGEQNFELAKMAVTSSARGQGFGDLLIESVIDFARQAGAEKLILVSNTRLGPAIKLYEKHGFRSVPITDAGDYSRVDIQMELALI
jgi:GNAT superfamily N-acetyltransferase